MGFLLGSRRRNREKTAEEEGEKSSRRIRQKSKESDKLSARPPPAPSKASSPKSSTTPQSHTSSSNTNRNVLFRDNRLPDGTTMPRIPTQQPAQVSPPLANGTEERSSPSGSLYSSASMQPVFPTFASYPASYVPQSNPRLYETPSAGRRGRVYSDGVYRSTYEEPMPKPDYPLSNDGTGNSNRDSGLDTESRSSSGGKPANVYDRYAQWRVTPSQQQLYKQPPSLRSRPMSRDPLSSVCSLHETPKILRPRGFQGSRNAPFTLTSDYYRRRADAYYGYNSATTPRRWVCHTDDLEEMTYRPRSASRQAHCSSCSCSDSGLREARSVSSLRRIQLEEENAQQRREQSVVSSRTGRRFRRDDEIEEEVAEYSKRTTSRGLPRNQPIRGKYFEERDEVDRYGRLPPVRRPISALPQNRRHTYRDDYIDENFVEDVDYSDEASDFQDGRVNRSYGARTEFFPRADSNQSLRVNTDTSVIRL